MDLHFEQSGGGHSVTAEYKLRGEANKAWKPIPVYTDASPSGSGTRLLVRDEPQRQEDTIASVSNVNRPYTYDGLIMWFSSVLVAYIVFAGFRRGSYVHHARPIS